MTNEVERFIISSLLCRIMSGKTVDNTCSELWGRPRRVSARIFGFCSITHGTEHPRCYFFSVFLLHHWCRSTVSKAMLLKLVVPGSDTCCYLGYSLQQRRGFLKLHSHPALGTDIFLSNYMLFRIVTSLVLWREFGFMKAATSSLWYILSTQWTVRNKFPWFLNYMKMLSELTAALCEDVEGKSQTLCVVRKQIWVQVNCKPLMQQCN